MADQPLPANPTLNRVVRVFISSTFRDMQAERDVLVKQVFPELRKRCRERAVEFVEVDLRWGVTEEQAKRGEVLPICLAEIHRCRPYFIGLLGERYGWVPDEIPRELIALEPWLAEHLHHSVTELEILHGVLNNPAMARRASFYFRDQAYLDTLPPERRGDFLSEDPLAQDKLAHLKDRIRRSGLPLQENYPDPETLGQWILTELWQAIDQEFPAEEVPAPLAREAAEHEAFALSRAKVYIGRPEYYDRLDRHVEGDEPPLVLLGESGVGKSALLANWVKGHRERHPEDFVFLHFLGSSPQSADYVALLRRLISELKRRSGDPEEVPVQPDKLREALPLWLARASAWAGREARRVIIILDALNQLEDKDNAPDLGWLPEYFPPQIRVILSTLAGRPFTALTKRGWPTFAVARLDSGEMRRAIQEYLGIYRKTLEAPLVGEIVAAPQAGNPLYLKALLEELRVFGVFEELENRVRHYLAAPDPPSLYGLILARLEEDYEKPRPGLVGKALTLIWAARRGLTESELLELLGAPDGPFPRAHWSPLYLALEDSLVSRSGLLNFFHDYLRQAVQTRYLPTPEAEGAAHLRLADYFETRHLDDRKVDELPWQWEQTQSWETLKDWLANLEVFLILMKDLKIWDLMRYWKSLACQGYDLAGVYQESLQRWQQSDPSREAWAKIIEEVGYFFQLNARFSEAASIYLETITRRQEEGDDDSPNIARLFNCLGDIYLYLGRYKLALDLFQRALKIWSKFPNQDPLQVGAVINNLALAQEAMGHYGDAERHLGMAKNIWEQAIEPENFYLASTLDNLGGIYRKQGRFAESETSYQRALALREKLLGPEHPDTATSLNNLACFYFSQAQHAEAESLYQRALTISEKILGPEHPETNQVLINLGELHREQGHLAAAAEFITRGLTLRERHLGRDNPEVLKNLHCLASLYADQERYAEAESLLKQGLLGLEQFLGPVHPDVARFCHNLGFLCQKQGKSEIAISWLQRALSIREKVWGTNHQEVATTLHNLADAYRSQGQAERARTLSLQALDIFEQSAPNHPDMASCLNDLALDYCLKEEFEKAEPLYRRALTIQEKVRGPEHPHTIQAQNNLAVIYLNLGRFQEAEPLCALALAASERLYRSRDRRLAPCLANLASAVRGKGRFTEAEAHYRRALEIQEEAGCLETLEGAITLENLAELQEDQGRYEQALQLYLKALHILTKVLGQAHPKVVFLLNHLSSLSRA